jgi:nucleoside-diphosphate-sugar epimerase
VTGGTGFIGRHLVARLVEVGAKVAILSRDGRSGLPDMELHVGDLRDEVFVRRAIRECSPDLIFHLASYKQRSAQIADFLPALETNVLGSLHLFDAAAGQATVKGIVVMGTAEEYGRNPTPFGESMREFPVSAYSYSKQSLTHLCEVLHHLHGLPAVILRPSIAYGPGQSPDMFLPALIQSLFKGAPFPMTAGEQTRDFVFVSDVVDAALRAALRPDLAGEVFNVGSGATVTIADLARRVSVLVGRPELLQIGSLSYRQGEVMSYGVDICKARTLLGWQPQVELEEGLNLTIEHCRRNGIEV